MDNKHYPMSLKVANCQICTIAESMKDCKTCAFNCGLVYKTCAKDEQLVPSISSDDTTQAKES